MYLIETILETCILHSPIDEIKIYLSGSSDIFCLIMSSYSTLWYLAPTSLGMVQYIKSNAYDNDYDIDTYPFIYPTLSVIILLPIYSKKDTEFLLSLLLFFLLICLNPPSYPSTIQGVVSVENCMSSGIFENPVGYQSIDILRQFSPLRY